MQEENEDLKELQELPVPQDHLVNAEVTEFQECLARLVPKENR